MHPPFISVYDHIEGYGRTKSISYRMWKGARKLNEYRKIEEKGPRKRYKRAVRKLREMRGL